jgi:orotidine-5'-phosphate decarboxylase
MASVTIWLNLTEPLNETPMTFIEKLKSAWKTNNSLACVGLDPDIAKFPHHLKNVPDSIFEFNKAIIDATHDLVCAYKPQIAYFAALSAENQLEKTIDYIKVNYPNIPVILDAKRGDIGSTAEMYATEAFSRYKADAVTINPYLGFDSIEPFIKYKDRGVILLCRTSNSGASDIQDLLVDGIPVYEKIADQIATRWNTNKNCLLVVGATWPSQMSRIREIVGDIPFLVPGVGAQGGDVEQLVKAGQTQDGTGLIISSSRAILYASNGPYFAQAARKVTLELRDTINQFRNIS